MRILFLLALLVSATGAFSQEKGETTFNNSCFPGLSVTVKNYGYLKDNGAYGWGIKIKNNYKRAVTFTYALVVGDEKRGNGQPTYSIEPGGTWANDWGRLSLLLKKSSSNEFIVSIWKLCFEGADCSDQNYFECDGRQIKDRVFGSDWRTKNNQASNQPTSVNNDNYKTASDLVTRKNELCTELGTLIKGANNNVYALCVARTYSANDISLLKAQISQLETEISRVRVSSNTTQQQQYQQAQQRQQQQQQQLLQQQANQQAMQRAAQQRAQQQQQQQQYNNSYNQAQGNLQGGNYQQAMQHYANAATTATNSGDKKVATAGVIVSGLAGLASAFQKKPESSATAPEVTEKDFSMDMVPYDARTAKDLASRFVAGFTKRPGVLTTPGGVLYQVLTPGTGAKPTATDNIKLQFRKTTVVGRQYKDVLATDKPEALNMSEIGPKLAEGIRTMNAGGKSCFVFPANVAGSFPQYPEGSVTIVWVIDLLEIVK